VKQTRPKPTELDYPLGAAARLTGLSPELLRAWELRYGAVVPGRSEGGSRRYTAADIERLRLVKAAVDAGHRIGQVARLDDDALRERATAVRAEPSGRLDDILDALDALDGTTAQRLLSIQLFALGPARFARECALPLVREIGERWSRDRMAIPSEHLATGILRSLLGAALQPSAATLRGPRIVFATPSGERHELGLLMAAVTAVGGGANPLYLGAEVPVEDLIAAVERTNASALALSVVTIEPDEATRALHAARGALPDDVHLWLGGIGLTRTTIPERTECFETLEALEQRVSLLCFERPKDR
jgi:DNA-binding transcriptional MerR regulator